MIFSMGTMLVFSSSAEDRHGISKNVLSGQKHGSNSCSVRSEHASGYLQARESFSQSFHPLMLTSDEAAKHEVEEL